MSLSVQCSVANQFSFKGKNVRSVHVKGEECLVSRDVCKAFEQEEESSKKSASWKLKLSLNQWEDIFTLHKDTVLLKESGLYCFLLRCKRDEAESLMEWAMETVLPREVRKLASVIEEKDAALTLLNDDLQNHDNQIQAIEYENVALQAQRDVYQAQLQKCQDTIIHLKTRYVDHARDPGKENIIIIVRKHTMPANDKFHDLPYYVARMQRRKRCVKLRWFDRNFPEHEVIVEIDNPNSIHAFNRLEEEGHAGRRYNHFRLIDLTRERVVCHGSACHR